MCIEKTGVNFRIEYYEGIKKIYIKIFMSFSLSF